MSIATRTGVALSGVATVSGIAKAGIATIDGIAIGGGASLWQSQLLDDDFFDGSSSQYISQKIRNTIGAVAIPKVVLLAAGNGAIANVFVELRSVENGGGVLYGTSATVACANGVFSATDFIFTPSVAIPGDFFICAKSADNAFRNRIKSGDPYEGPTYAGYQGGSIFTAYDLYFEVWKD